MEYSVTVGSHSYCGTSHTIFTHLRYFRQSLVARAKLFLSFELAAERLAQQLEAISCYHSHRKLGQWIVVAVVVVQR